MPSAEKIFTVKSTHVGRGLFARTAFESDHVICELQGTFYADPEYGSEYCIDVGDNSVMEPVEPYRFLNHSCQPNCELILWKKRRIDGRLFHRVWLQTLRSIAVGEELTIDYSWPASNAIPCACGSDNCRGWIVHPAALHEIKFPAQPDAKPARNRRPR